MKLSQLALITHGQLVGSDAECKDVVIDSRSVRAGDCFIAIQGDVFDGHQFIADVISKGAAVAIVSQSVEAAIPVIHVADTRQALKAIAAFYRDSVEIPVAAITGSCGKTTTRALLESILKRCGNVLASKKSFNNDIGLPLTLLQLMSSHDFAVLEIGTNHPGEIADLTAIAKPTVSVVTMVAPVHIEHFQTVDRIAREKGAIFEGLAQNGIAVINADDAHMALWQEQADGHRVVTFGQTHRADVMAVDVRSVSNGQTHFTLVYKNERAQVKLPLLGEHNVVNALAAAATAVALGIAMDDICKGLAAGQTEYGRLEEKIGFAGAVIIDDSYNANPASVKAAISLLTHRSKNAILVLGDMGELGDLAQQFHEEVGLFAKQAGVKKLFCYGKNAVFYAKAFGQDAQHFEDYASLGAAVKACLTADAAVLVKGSRSMKMETVVKELI